MKPVHAVVLMMLLGGGAPASATVCPLQIGDDPVVAMDTSLGRICIQLFASLAPLTVANFQGYVERGEYEGTFIHRSVPGFVIQGGGFRASDYEPIFDEASPMVDNEPDCDGVEPDRCNLLGTVAMAKTSDPHSAVSQWFINLANNGGRNGDTRVGLDAPGNSGGFTVFGQVIEGTMSVAQAIAALPVRDLIFDIDSPQRDIFGNTPLQTDLVEDPEGYGCFEPLQIAALTTLDQLAFEPDPVTGFPFYWVSIACSGAPDTGCTDPDRLLIVPPNLPFPNAPCEMIEASDASLAARRADLGPQVPERLVQVLKVPEPFASEAAGAAALALLYGAGRRMRRNVQRAPDSRRSATWAATPR